MSRFVCGRCASQLFSPSKSVIALMMLFSLGSIMCAPPRADRSGAVPTEAAATAVRRTAVAEVQRLISGPEEPTPTPQVTATPRPSCDGAIWWYEARGHVGESRVIERVLRVRPGSSVEMTAVLEIGQFYPDPTGFAVVVPATGADAFVNKTVCVQGRIAALLGAPAIIERDPQTIKVVN
jgi:hypothetical protein